MSDMPSVPNDNGDDNAPVSFTTVVTANAGAYSDSQPFTWLIGPRRPFPCQPSALEADTPFILPSGTTNDAPLNDPDGPPKPPPAASEPNGAKRGHGAKRE
jgi:hypothetical protein